MSVIIFQISLESLARSGPLSVLDITPVATPGRFRLIDCAQYIHDRTLSIHEFPDFPVTECTYAAISYIWCGNSVDESTVGPRFSVAGAKDGDPIGVDVLVHACTAALREGAKCIWLDRLCIMQTSKEDKHWQIAQMFDIYKRCSLCIVLPGGVQRLVGLDEHTTWINRGWTLQETLAPPRVEVVYSWKWGSGMYYRDRGVRGNIIQLIPGESAMTPLSNVFSLYGSEPMNFFPSADGSHITFRTELFGPLCSPSSNVILEQTTEVVIFMLKDALVKDSSRDGSDFDIRAPPIWRSALFRTSKHPVDMVFSIMGLFGVTLDTRKFSKDDRLGATIALMQAILHRGGRASWLGAAPYLPVNPRLSTFPAFPRTNVRGQVLFEFDSRAANEQKRRSHKRNILDTRRLEMPMGTMDAAGYLTISRKSLRIYPLLNIEELHQGHSQDFNNLHLMAEPPQSCLNLSAINGTDWKFYEDPAGDSDKNSPRTFAVLLGWFNEFSHEGFWNGPCHIGTLLIKEHAPNRFHVESFFALSHTLRVWIESWQEHTLHIGGPESDSRRQSAGIEG
ncbi:hypothetical protein IW261DRAFT_1059912 [Armillaria novae-zelandiae]|uniref:Heterokaryon incompatibility domain-containing protein n=1 Tax=Armillaria novae-zelandiae TaxID=153914 RepID=A0AA39TVD3_9AGAR|nr:hypothetical protein IW261DRAFT_1059912 [Armillaria novae-zelandiae]